MYVLSTLQENSINEIIQQVDASKLRSLSTRFGVRRFTEELATLFFGEHELATSTKHGNGKKRENWMN